MFLDESFVVILFKLINLSVFILLVVYIFKKYILDDIKTKIANKQKAISELQDKAIALVDDIRIIEQHIQKDELMCRELKARVVEWRTQAERIANDNLKKRQKQMASLAEHAEQKTLYLQRQSAYEDILPTVIEQSRTTLEQKFEHEAAADTFIAQLITSLQRSK